MKIRFLLHNAFDAGGGVLMVTFALAEELARRHDVEIISVFGSPPTTHAAPAGVRVRTLATRGDRVRGLSPRNRRAARTASELVPPIESRYEYYNRWTDGLLEKRLRKLRGGALVVMQPGLIAAAGSIAPQGCVLVAQEHVPFDRRPLKLRKAYRRHASAMDSFLTLTRSDARRYRRWMRGKVPVRAIPNGMPPYDGPRADHERPLAVAVGRLGVIKGFDILIRAWEAVAAVHPEWELEIWGEGRLEPDLRDQIAAAGLEGRVHLRGFSTQVRREMARASLFVLSSRAEGYPRVIQEAMACALPVVSTDCPAGPREMITPGVDGVLVPNEDADALADAIIGMIEAGADRRRAMGRAAEERVRDMGQDAIAMRWERLLTRLEREKLDASGGRP